MPEDPALSDFIVRVGELRCVAPTPAQNRRWVYHVPAYADVECVSTYVVLWQGVIIAFVEVVIIGYVYVCAFE